jgi:hypothetical protein
MGEDWEGVELIPRENGYVYIGIACLKDLDRAVIVRSSDCPGGPSKIVSRPEAVRVMLCNDRLIIPYLPFTYQASTECKRPSVQYFICKQTA